MPTDIADVNRSAYSTRQVGNWYARQHSGLDKDEHAAFQWLLGSNPAGVRSALDLGVGAGRTTLAVRAIASRYVGVDFSPKMVEICRRRFPRHLEFRVGDARDLSMFESDSFEFVFFSYNGIDYVDHAGRLKILAEVHRVLKSRGYFIFSSHNRQVRRENLLRDRPLWYLAHLPWMIAGEIRHRRLRRFEINTYEYEIRNDTGNGSRLLTYYIDPARQVEQLKQAGFDDIEIFDTKGRHVARPAVGHRNDYDSPWLCYFCRRKELI